MNPRRFVLLDRDGVISVYTPGYIVNAKDFQLAHGSEQALEMFYRNGYEVVVITNQSCINRGLATRQDIDAVNRRMVEEVKNAGGRIRDIFLCPHTDADNCSCRKPKPGMILDAASKYGIELSQTFFVGDSFTDFQAARSAGCRSIICMTGNPKTMDAIDSAETKPDAVLNSLLEAAEFIITP